MQPKATKLSEDSLVNSYLKSILIYQRHQKKERGGGRNTRSKKQSYSTMFSLVAHIGKLHLQVEHTTLIL